MSQGKVPLILNLHLVVLKLCQAPIHVVILILRRINAHNRVIVLRESPRLLIDIVPDRILHFGLDLLSFLVLSFDDREYLVPADHLRAPWINSDMGCLFHASSCIECHVI